MNISIHRVEKIVVGDTCCLSTGSWTRTITVTADGIDNEIILFGDSKQVIEVQARDE